MGQVVWLDQYRERRRVVSSLSRLDAAVARLDLLLRRGGGRIGPTVERELTAIMRDVTIGLEDRAADRAERLLGMLEHPVASG